MFLVFYLEIWNNVCGIEIKTTKHEGEHMGASGLESS